MGQVTPGFAPQHPPMAALHSPAPSRSPGPSVASPPPVDRGCWDRCSHVPSVHPASRPAHPQAPRPGVGALLRAGAGIPSTSDAPGCPTPSGLSEAQAAGHTSGSAHLQSHCFQKVQWMKEETYRWGLPRERGEGAQVPRPREPPSWPLNLGPQRAPATQPGQRWRWRAAVKPAEAEAATASRDQRAGEPLQSTPGPRSPL